MSRQRVFPFNGNDDEYIIYLETKLLEAQNSSSWAAPALNSPPTPPSSTTDDLCNRSNEPMNSESPTLALQPQPPSLKRSYHGPPFHAKRHQTSHLRTTECPDTSNDEPNWKQRADTHVWKLSGQPHKPIKALPQWKEQLDKLIRSIPSPEEWTELRKRNHFYTVTENRSVIDILLGKSSRIESRTDTILSTSTDSPWAKSAFTYACRTAALQADAELSSNVAMFRMLIVASTCGIMLKTGVQTEDVDSIMRGCFGSKTGYKNLKRYREGARWANTCISELSARGGWGNRSAEVFFLCGRMPSYYGRISSNSQESIPHFVKEMKITEKDLEKDLEDPERDPRWTPISIPCIIIRLFGQFVLLRDVCDHLRYDYNSVYDMYRRFYMTDEEKMTQERRTHDPMLYDGSIEPLPNRPGINNSIGEQRIEYAAPVQSRQTQLVSIANSHSPISADQPLPRQDEPEDLRNNALARAARFAGNEFIFQLNRNDVRGFFSDPHSPSPPQALLVSENLFYNIKVYFENSCRNMNFDDHGNLLTPNGAKLDNAPCNDFDSYCFTATIFMEKGLHVDFRRALSRASALVEQILRVEHPRTLACFLEVFLHLIQTGLPEVTSSLCDYIKRMSTKVTRKGHPWGQICRLLGELDSESLDQAMAQIWKCTTDIFDSELGTFNRLAVSVRLDYIKRVVTNHLEEERLLQNLLAQFGGNPRLPTPRVMLNLAHNLNRQGRHDEAEKMALEVLSLLQGYEIYAGRIVERIESLKIVSRSQFNQGKTLAAEQTMREAIQMIVDQWGIQHSWVPEFMSVLEGWLRVWGRKEDANTLQGEIEELIGKDEIDK